MQEANGWSGLAMTVRLDSHVRSVVVVPRQAAQGKPWLCLAGAKAVCDATLLGLLGRGPPMRPVRLRCVASLLATFEGATVNAWYGAKASRPFTGNGGTAVKLGRYLIHRNRP